MGLLDFITGNNQQNNNQNNNSNQGQQQSTQFSPITNYSAGNQNPPVQNNSQNPGQNNFTNQNTNLGNSNSNQQGQVNPFGGSSTQTSSPYVQSQNNPPTYVESNIHQGAKTFDPLTSSNTTTFDTNNDAKVSNSSNAQSSEPVSVDNNSNYINNPQPVNSNSSSQIANDYVNPNPAMTPPLADDQVNTPSQNEFAGINNDPSMDELEKTLTQAPQTTEIDNYSNPTEIDQSNSIEAILNNTSSNSTPESNSSDEESASTSLENILNSSSSEKLNDKVVAEPQTKSEENVNQVTLDETTQTDESAIDTGSIDTTKDEVKIGLNTPSQNQENAVDSTSAVANKNDSTIPVQPATENEKVSESSLDEVTKKFVNTDFSNLNLGNIGSTDTPQTPVTNSNNINEDSAVENKESEESSVIQEKEEDKKESLSVNPTVVSGLTSATLASQITSPEVSLEKNIDTSEETKNPIEENITTAANLNNSVFKKIGFIGLNGSKTDTSLSNHVRRISKKLASENVELLIDSRKGLGEFVIQGVNDANKKFTGVYLKPFMSVEAESPKQYIEETQGTSVLYSNYLERLKHLVKESRLFVFFNGGGLQNLSALSTVWSIANMYKGHNKPIILFGDSWEGTLKTMQNDFGLSKSDLETIVIVRSADELLNKINELSSTYSNNKMVSVERVVDRRVEGDEKDFIVY